MIDTFAQLDAGDKATTIFNRDKNFHAIPLLRGKPTLVPLRLCTQANKADLDFETCKRITRKYFLAPRKIG